MSSDIDNQPYDNVEFPVRRPPQGVSGYPGMTPTQRGNLITGGTMKTDKGYALAPVAEGGLMEEEEGELPTVEDQRQKVVVPASRPETQIKQTVSFVYFVFIS